MEGILAQPRRGLRAPKSRSGCRTCKTKRLKCDETKPACFQCQKRNLICPGYQQVIKWEAKNAVSACDYKRNTRKSCGPGTTSFKVRPLRSRQRCTQAFQDAGIESAQDSRTESDDLVEATLSPSALMTSRHERLNSWDNVGISCDGFAGCDAGHSRARETSDIQLSNNNLSANLDAFSSYSNALDTFVIESSLEGLELMSAENHEATSAADQSHFVPSTTSQRSKPAPGTSSSRSLLRRFYRLAPSPQRPLELTSTKLVQYYFSTICGLYSCFDSPLNPFRTSVSRVWTISAATYYAIQSMAAAHLANELPYMREKGLLLHREASKHLAQEVYKCCHHDRGSSLPLMTILLLGLSACWQQASDLGLPYLRTARSLMYAYLARVDHSQATLKQNRFFEEAMIYWEMMMSFVRDEDDVITMHIDVSESCTNGDVSNITQNNAGIVGCAEPIHVDAHGMHDGHFRKNPHPWTGISPQSQILLAEVGRLIRRVRVGPSCDVAQQAQHLSLALELEQDLLSLDLPDFEAGIDSGDPYTQSKDFITLAKATRDCGLLELYRVFPDLLDRKLGLGSDLSPLSGFEVGASDYDVTNTALLLSSGPHWQSWLTSFAIRILNSLECIPSSSGVRAQQLLLLLIAGAELRLPLDHHSEYPDGVSTDMEVSCSRSFARARLSQLSVQLPSQPVRVIMNLLIEVWSRVDASISGSEHDIFWMDVMVEKGWHTVMG